MDADLVLVMRNCRRQKYKHNKASDDVEMPSKEQFCRFEIRGCFKKVLA